MDNIGRFRRFVGRAEALIEADRLLSDPELLRTFRRLVARGREHVIGPARRTAALLRDQFMPIKQVLLDSRFDLLRVAGLTGAEDPYTELIAWTLDPRVHPDSAWAVQRAWLKALGIADGESVDEPAVPRTQVWLEGEIPDLVLEYADFIVVVEAKTGTVEHTTRSGTHQTESYPLAVGKASANPDLPVRIVFLTVDGCRPVNPRAVPTTYLVFAVALARVVNEQELPTEISQAFRMIASHFAHCAVLDGLDVCAMVQDLTSSPAAELPESAVLRHLSTIQQAAALLGIGE